jgi:hypothetical protein
MTSKQSKQTSLFAYTNNYTRKRSRPDEDSDFELSEPHTKHKKYDQSKRKRRFQESWRE